MSFYNYNYYRQLSSGLLIDFLFFNHIRFNFTIKQGNEEGYFSLGLQSGVLSLLHPLTLSPDHPDHFLLTIVAQNSQFPCHRGRVRVAVIVVPDQLQLPVLNPISVPEDTEIGTEVLSEGVLVVGGVEGGVVFSLAEEGNEGGVFVINATTGVISLAGELDFETLSGYLLTIMATSVATGNSDTTTLSVEVLDINEPPSFSAPACAVKPPGDASGTCEFSVLENEPVGTLVSILIGADPDFPSRPNGNLSFELVGVAGEEVSGVGLMQNGSDVIGLITTAMLDRELMSSLSFVLRVTDAGAPPLSCDVTVTITVGDVNDNAPMFIQESPILKVLESTSVGEIIAEYITVDDDEGVNALVRYSLISLDPPLNQSDLPFTIDPVTGLLNVSSPLDFEDISNYELAIVASNPDGLSANVSTIVLIIDVNDNAPSFVRDEYVTSVPEDASLLTLVQTVLASDEDTALNGRVTYSITAGDPQGVFGIEELLSPGNNSVLGMVVTSALLDRETTPTFNLTITASDLGSPSLSDTAMILVSVTDANDNAPMFDRDLYEVVVREDAMPTSLLSIAASDADQPETPNSEIMFALDFNASTDTASNVFDLVTADNGTSTTLRLIGQLDFDSVPLYELQVVATDNGTTPLSSETTVRVIVRDVGSPPVVTGGNQTVGVSEARSPGEVVARINATDLDGQALNYTIVSVRAGTTGDSAPLSPPPFSVDSAGRVSLETELDFEEVSSYLVKILVTDGIHTTEAVLTVNVLDENEFAPVITNPAPITFQVQEEVPSGTLVGTVTATDGDASSALTYRIVQDSSLLSSVLEIDSQNGTIFVGERLDREAIVEQDASFPSEGEVRFITVEVTDNGVPSRSTTARVGVAIQDINDNAPVFPDLTPPPVVAENREVGVVFSVAASDRDAGVNAEVTYSLEGVPPTEPVPFEVDPEGNVLITRVLDAETDPTSYMIQITASDGGTPTLSTSESLVIFVSDLNDNAPVFPQESYEFSLDEDSQVGVGFFQFFATDEDRTAPNNQLMFLLDSSPSTPPGSLDLFSLDPQTGVLSVEGVLDFEAMAVHEFVVLVRDSGTPPLSSAPVPVTIRLRDVDERPPRFLQECSVTIIEFSLPPNADPSPIGECIAADVDDATGEFLFGVPLVYEILTGNVNGTFSIGSDGTIFLVESVDREVSDAFLLTVLVRDEGGFNATTSLSVTILDVNDNSPVILNDTPVQRNITADEISAGESNFVSILASDSDAGRNAELSFLLLSTSVDSSGSSASLVVAVSDGGAQPLVTVVDILLSFEEPCFLQDHTIDPSDGRVLTRLLCSVAVAPPTVSVMEGDSISLTCSSLTNLQDISYDFRHNEITNVIPASSGDTLVIAMATLDSAGEYFCAASSEIGVLLSSAASEATVQPRSIQGKLWLGMLRSDSCNTPSLPPSLPHTCSCPLHHHTP